MKVLSKGIKFLQINGVFFFSVRFFSKCFNFLFNLASFHRIDIDIDHSAKVKGLKYIEIGSNFHAGKQLWLEAVVDYYGQRFSPLIRIGNNVSFQDFVHIGATNYVEIGDNVLFASKVYVSDHNHGIYDGDYQSNPQEPPRFRQLTSNKEVKIEENVWIGDAVTILPGVHIGKGSIIGANSVVAKDIPEFSIAVGVPAKVIKKYDVTIDRWVSL